MCGKGQEGKVGFMWECGPSFSSESYVLTA